MKIFITILLFFLVLNDIFCQDIPGYPSFKANTNTIKPPATLDKAIGQIDFLLKNEIIDHFKRENETIAVINISSEFGDFFINRWLLKVNTGFNQKITSDSYSNLQRFFFKQGINNPEIMIRVVFHSYHKKLNNIDYSLESEIERAKTSFNVSEYYVSTIQQYHTALASIKNFEDSILFIDKLANYSLNDTLGRRYYERNRKSTFYITGTIDRIDFDKQQIVLKIIDIVSDKRYQTFFYNNEYLAINDILCIEKDSYRKYGGWFKFNHLYFDYRNGNYRMPLPKWNEYLKIKLNIYE